MQLRGAIGDELAGQWLASLAAAAAYASLHVGIPDFADPPATEVFDPGYARQSVAWQFINGRAIATTTITQFNVSLSTTVLAIGFHRTLVTSQMLAYAEPPVDTSVRVSDAGLLTFDAGELVLSLP